MIRRKFSLNFRETFGSGKTDGKPTRSQTDQSDEYSPPPSPHPGRRSPLPARTEVDLRLACAAIVTNTIPSDVFVEAAYEDLGKPQLDYTALRSNSDQSRARSGSVKKHTRNFSNPAANLDLPDFPVPNAVPDKSKYGYKPDTALKDLFVNTDRAAHYATQADLSRRRAESISNLEKGAARTPGRSASKSFSVVSNLPLANPPVRNQVRPAFSQETDGSLAQTDFSEHPLDHTDPSASSSALAPARPEYASHHGSVDRRGDGDLERTKTEERGRQKRKSWYNKVFSSGGDGAKKQEQKESRPQSRARSQGRSRSLSQGVREYIRPGSTHGEAREASRRTSRATSTHSRRSSASSGVIPPGRQVFSWKSWRQSWSSWRDASEDDLDPNTSRVNKRRSMQSLKNRMSVNLNRDLPPLPSIDQWKEEPENPVEVPPSKPKHIASLWNKAASKRRSMDFKKSDYRKSMEVRQPSDTGKSADFKRKAEYRKSYSDLQTAQRAQHMSQLAQIDASLFESPILPHVMAQMGPPPAKSPKVSRKPLPPSKSTPTDSVMDDQDTSAALLVPKTTLEVPSVPSPPPTEPLPPPPPPTAAPPPIPTEAAAANPASSAATSKQAKRRSSNYSWLPVETYTTPPIVPNEASDAHTASPANTSKQAKRRSSNYSWLPVESYIPPTVTHQQRPTRPTPDQMPMGVPSAVPSRMLDRRQGSTTSATSSIDSMEFYNSLQSAKYQYADDIQTLSTPPPVPPKDGKKKLKLPWEKKKPMTWMDEMEKLGIKDGVLMTDQLNGPPIVRY